MEKSVKNKFRLSKTLRSNLITYGIVIAAFIIVQLLVNAGQVSSLMKGLLVPLCIYTIMAIWDFLHNRKSPYSGLIRECIGFIEENYSQNITLDNAAAAVNISSSYLSFIFKQETGINFSVYLTNYRIEMSKRLILKSNLKIYEIAEQVGFGSPYYFSKVFKEIVGMTCKEFKNRV